MKKIKQIFKTVTLVLAFFLVVMNADVNAQILYGMTHDGGSYNLGTLFHYNTLTGITSVDFNFDSTHGANPFGGLMQASNGKLYGMTYNGGSINEGVLFEFNVATGLLRVVANFTYGNGESPWGSLIQASNGLLYGMAIQSGPGGTGDIFSYNTVTDTLIKLYNLNYDDGINPRGNLCQATNGKLYGLICNAGNNNWGTMFDFDIPSSTFTKVLDFTATNGGNPLGGLVQASNGKLYGMTTNGGNVSKGVVFEYNTTTNVQTVDINLNALTGDGPYGNLIQASNGKLYGLATAGGTHNYGTLFEFNTATDSLHVDVTFDSTTNGGRPMGSLFQASNGKMYGMTILGGTHNLGTLFEFDPSTNHLATVVSFDGINGADPYEEAQMTEYICLNPDVPVLSASSNTICIGNNPKLYVSNGLLKGAANWEWHKDSCNGSIIASGDSIIVSPTITTTYYVRGEGGCVLPGNCGTITITVNPYIAPTPFITTVNNATTNLCSGDTVGLIAGNYVSYLWSNAATTDTIMVGDYQNYIVTVTDGNGCAASASRTTTLHILPVTITTVNNSPTTICTGDSVGLIAGGNYASYHWNTFYQNYNYQPAYTDTFTVGVQGNYFVTVTDNNNCTGTASVYVTIVADPVVEIVSTGAITSNGGSVTLDAGVWTSYLWNNGATSESITITDTGNYTVTVTNATGCPGMSSEWISIVPSTTTVFQKTYSIGTTSIGNYAEGSFMVTTNDGGYFFGGKTRDSVYNEYFQVMKTDAHGVVQMSKGYLDQLYYVGGPVTSGIQTTDGGYAIYGNIQGVGWGDDDYLYNDIDIIRLNSSLDTVWSKNFEYLFLSSGIIKQTSDGGFILTAIYGGEHCYYSGYDTRSSIIKLDANGNGVFQSEFADGSTDCFSYSDLDNLVISNVIEVSDGGFMAVGSSSTYGAFVIKTDNMGNYLWNNSYPGCSGFSDIKATPDFGYILTGTSSSGHVDLVKIDSIGNVLMATIYGGNGSDGGSSVQLTSDGGYVIGGYTNSFDAGHYYMIKTDNNMNLQWSKNYGGGYESASSVQQTADRGYILGGSSASFNANQNDEMYLVKTDSLGNSGCNQTNSNTIVTSQSITISHIPLGSDTGVFTTSPFVAIANNGALTHAICPCTISTPTIHSSALTSFCQGTSDTLDAGSYTTYLWNTGASTETIVATSGGTYSVTVSDASGCTGTASIIISVDNPTPIITANGATTYCSGGSVTLDAGLFSSYLWSTSDSTETILATDNTIYSVTVTDSLGCMGTASQVVTINPNPTPSIYVYGDTTFCQGGQAVLDPGTFASYSWSNGDSTEYNAVTSSGNYMVTVTDNNGCTGIAAQAITVNQNPVPSITGPTTACAGSDVTLDAGTWTSYSWNNGATTESITENTSGYYAVVVTDANGCTGNANTYLTIFDVPYSYINLNSSSALCETVTLGAYSYNQITAYSWNTGDTTQTITVTSDGDYAVTITDNNGCPGTATLEVDSIPQSNVSIYVYGNATFCQGGSVYLDPGTYTSYLWNTGDTTELINVSTSNNYVVTVTNDIGCTGTASVLITVNPNPTPTITGPTSACAGSPFTLSTGSYSSYIWSDGDTTESTTTTNGGYIQVTVMDGNGCTGVASTFVTINPSPNPTIIPNGPTTFCSGGSVTLDAGSYLTYNWVTGETTESITVFGSEPYCVTVSDANGCTGATCINVDVFANPNPVITPNGPTSFCIGGSVGLNAGNSYTNYLWSNGATTQSITATTTGTYTVTVTASGGCTSSNSIAVTELPPPSPIVIPNGPTSFCAGGSVTLDAGIYSSYHWSTGATNEYLIVTTANTYKVTVTTPQGCTGISNNVIVTISPNITGLTITGATSVCTGTNVTLSTNTTYNSYLWSTGATTQSLNILATGIYYVTVSNGANCTATAHHSVTFQINPTPVIVPTNLSNICGGGNATLTVSSVYSTYNWSTAATTQAITINTGGTYTVTVLSTNGCTGTTSLIATSSCSLPTTFSTTNISATGGMANWMEPTCYYGFTLRISKHNQNVWTNHTITPNTHYTFSGLTHNTQYDWQIQTNCNASGSINSGFSASQTFTTLARLEEGETDNIDYAFNVYPNPTNDHVTIAFTAGIEEAYTIRLMDVTGRCVLQYALTSTIGENQFQLNLSTVAKGIYMVLLQNKDALLQSKIVVQ